MRQEKLKTLENDNITSFDNVAHDILKDQYISKILTDKEIVIYDDEGFPKFNNDFIINEKSIQDIYNMKVVPKKTYKKKNKKIKNNKKNTKPISNTPVDNSSSSKLLDIDLAMELGENFMTLGNQINEIKIVQHGNIAALINFDERIKDLIGKIELLTTTVKGLL